MKMTITKKTGLLIFATLLLLSFLLINFSSSVIFGGRYFDFTSDKRLSLNQKTKDMLKEMTTPITIRLYVSSGIEKAYPRMWQYSKAIIKLLEQSHYVEYIEDPNMASRVMMTVAREELYKIEETDSQTEQLLQTLLRSYTGLFADYVFINEELLIQRSGLSHDEVYARLIFLSKRGILHYIPRKRIPMIYFPQRRIDISQISIPKEVYEERKARMEHRINSMLAYADSEQICRTQILLNYFGEKTRECGTCDICIQKAKETSINQTFRQIEQEIRNIIGKQSVTLEEIIDKLTYPEQQIVDVLRFLCDEGYISNNNEHYKLN